MMQYIFGLLETLYKAPMSYMAARFFIMVLAAVVLYYIFPKKARWVVLLASSGYFYYEVSSSVKQILILLISIVVSYIAGLLISKAINRNKSKLAKVFVFIGIVGSTAPLLITKCSEFITTSITHSTAIDWIIPVGLSFYSMQIIAYMVDIYRGKIQPQRNPLKYTLFVSFFPIIIQGPISRYDQLNDQLIEGHSYNTDKFMRGIQLILWGVFLKYMIADKAAVFVNAVFANYRAYSGVFIWIAAILYSIQLYTDFLSCVTISQGVAGLFGIDLIDNFKRPYFSTSIKDFWRRWHISFSSWLRDYIYIPLGGNRKGKLRKNINLIATFSVSGIWHGGQLRYLIWGLMHAGYQISGDIIGDRRELVMNKLSLSKDTRIRRVISMLSTSFLVMIAWIIFRAASLKDGIKMILSMFKDFNPWVLFDNSLFRVGLSQKEFEVLFVAVLVLILISVLQERGIVIRDWFNKQNIIIRWTLYLGIIWTVWIFGTYGFGFNSADFIYGGF